MSLPPIPRRMWSQLGPIPITRVAHLVDEEGTRLLGRFNPEERTIELRKGIALVTAWQTLYHEMIHVWAWDAGIGGYHTFGEEGEERLADVLSAALVGHMQSR